MNYKPGNRDVSGYRSKVVDGSAIEAEYQAAGTTTEYDWVRSRAKGDGAAAERLIELVAIRNAADVLLAIEVRRLRATSKWASWERLGEHLGLTKQGAAQRYGA